MGLGNFCLSRAESTWTWINIQRNAYFGTIDFVGSLQPESATGNKNPSHLGWETNLFFVVIFKKAFIQVCKETRKLHPRESQNGTYDEIEPPLSQQNPKGIN